jgi:hypothetical protein
LITGANSHVCLGYISAGGTIDQVYAELSDSTRELNRLLDVPASFNPVGGGNPCEQGISLRPDFADGLDNLAKQTNSVLERSSIAVLALIAERREKLMHQVTMRGMNFQNAKTCLASPARRSSKRLDDRANIVLRQRCGNGVTIREKPRRLGP